MIHYISRQISNFDSFNTKITIEEAVKYCKSKKILGVDTETEGFFDFKNRMIMFQIGDEEEQFVIDTRGISIEPFREVLEDPNIEKVLWNAKFDYLFIKHWYGIRMNNIFDAFIAECLVTNGKKDRQLSLAAVSERELEVKMDKDERNKFVGLNGQPFTERQIRYGANDVINLPKLRNIVHDKLTKYELHRCMSLESKFLPVLGNIELNGLYLNTQLWLDLEDINAEELVKAEKELDAYTIETYPQFKQTQLNLFSDEAETNIDWSSPKQVIKVAQATGIDTFIEEKGIWKHTVGEKHISKYRNNNKWVDLYLKYKGLQKAVTTYGKDYIKHVNPITGRVHCGFWQIRNTGRISCMNPNLQQIPAGKHRDCFTPEEGNKLVICDYSAQEQRILADICKDPSLLDFYETGDGDMHCLVARKVFDEIQDLSTKEIKENHSKKRQFAKAIGFAMNYGGSAHTIADRLQVPLNEAEEMVNAYFSGFPGMTKYFKEKTRETLDNGYITIDELTKRKFFIADYDKYKQVENKVRQEGFWTEYRQNKDKYKDIVKFYFQTKGKIQRNSQNYPIQGSAGSMTKLAAIIIDNKLKNESNEIKIVNLVHDEIVMECPEALDEKVAQILSSSMEEAGDYFCKTVPMKAEAVIADVWEH